MFVCGKFVDKMNKPSKSRLCWNCEGSVSVEAETCPYCGVSVVPASLDSVSASFTPSYRIGSTPEAVIPRSPYTVDDGESVESAKEQTKESDESVTDDDQFRHALFAAVMLLAGSVLFIFGLALMLFSNNGIFVLKWDGSLWFVYLAIAFPFLFAGWRFFSKLD